MFEFLIVGLVLIIAMMAASWIMDLSEIIIVEWKERRAAKRKLVDDVGLQILQERLELERKRLLRLMKEREAADQEILDRAEEYRNDFGNRS